MINALSYASYGLKVSANQFEKAAQNVVKASTPTSADPAAAAGDTGGEDLASAIVDSKTSEIGYKASAAAFKAADKMMGTLLDTVA